MKIEGKEYRTIWFYEKNQTVKIIEDTVSVQEIIKKSFNKD